MLLVLASTLISLPSRRINESLIEVSSRLIIIIIIIMTISFEAVQSNY